MDCLTLDVIRPKAGQYILLGWKGEFHPFTLTSAPEESCISVHIRAPNSCDWCSALRKRLTETAPAQAVGDAPKAPKAPQVFEYKKHTLQNSQIVYNVPKVTVMPGGRANVSSAVPTATDKVALPGQVAPPSLPTDSSAPSKPPPLRPEGDPMSKSGESLMSSAAEQLLPPEAVVLQVTGPFGAPAQKVWGFDTLMVVGAGIGVTPFASILRSVQLRAKQRETILRRSRDDPSLEKMVKDLIQVPKKIYFYWICRGQEEFDWFCDLLSAAAEGPAASIVEITLFLTGEHELSTVKKLPCATGQFFGRPNWGRIFKQNRDKHPGEHIGVFLCGSPIIGVELSKQSQKNSDLLGAPNATRFSFFKEHF
ncbi:unnamed protein product [Effrenium voratum]|nr:unnamed protein product [Effrenium voratum]